MAQHTCQLPERPDGSTAWRCPGCMTRYVWSKRMVGRTMHEGWSRMRDDFETRSLRSEAEFNRFARKAIVAGVVGALVVVALIVWIVLRVTA